MAARPGRAAGGGSVATEIQRPQGGQPYATTSRSAMPPPTSSALQALGRECKQMQRMRVRGELPTGIDLAPKADNLMEWAACIHGPPGSPYEGGLWNLDITFPSDYPMSPPKIRFRTPICHPNINPDGRICLDVTGGHTGKDFHRAWSAALTIDKVLLQVVAMMSDPNFQDPWVPMTPEQWRQRAAQDTREKASAETSHVPQCEMARADSPKPMPALEARDLEGDDDDDDGLDDEDDEMDDEDEDGEGGGEMAQVKTRTAADAYAAELSQLRTLGVTGTDEELLDALKRARGNVSDVFEQRSGGG
eukprot:Hpha_TRINITY_DN1041_c0_g1::TRINITY_DN1041_c0_g1_i1::g.84770::m.84770/K20217/UBE2E; ubiquitin-conjugating enzyme E2 E